MSFLKLSCCDIGLVLGQRQPALLSHEFKQSHAGLPMSSAAGAPPDIIEAHNDAADTPMSSIPCSIAQACLSSWPQLGSDCWRQFLMLLSQAPHEAHLSQQLHRPDP